MKSREASSSTSSCPTKKPNSPCFTSGGISECPHSPDGERSMIIGVPKEIKTDEYRVAMIPVGVEELTKAGHKVLIQAGAGQGSGIGDDRYSMHGAEIVTS